MNFTYFKFLFIDTIKRKSVWITWLLYLLTVLVFLIILPVASTLSVYQLWANTTIAICQTFVGLAAAIFTAVLAINIFKNSNEEGTELIIISKPISRIKIVLSKFVMFFTLCILVNLTAVLISVFTILVPGLEKKFYWGLVISMFIGNLVTFGIFGAIAILLTVRFAKAGIIVTNVVISVVLFVYQVLAVFVFTSSFKSLTGTESGSIITYSFILPLRQADGSFKEDHFVSFISSTNKQGEYDMKVTDWAGVKDYWDKENAKTNQTAIIATDIGTQLSVSYLTVGVNGYSDRQAYRMYNFSRYYQYELTKPASPEYYLLNSPLKFVYSTDTDSYVTLDGQKIYVPLYYCYPGLRSTKSSFLKGTVTDVIPIADLKGKDLLSYADVTFEKDDYNKYSPLFDIMYDNIFRYDITKQDGSYYYDLTDAELASYAQNVTLNTVWCNQRSNLNKFYKLIWACMTGHHGDAAYFGKENDPLAGKTKDDFGIKSVYDLNYRYLQFKDYCFYKIYDEQHEMMMNGVGNDPVCLAIEKDGYEQAKTALEAIVSKYGMTCSGDGIGDYGYVLRATPNGGSTLIQPSTQTINNTLLRNTIDKVKAGWTKGWTSDEWLNYAQNGSYAKWLKTSKILINFVYYDELYLFNSLTNPDRDDNYTSQQYVTLDRWYPYSTNLAYKELGTYLPYGQNLQLSMFETTNRVQFWVFAVIWGCIALAAYGAAFVIYNKYDIK